MVTQLCHFGEISRVRNKKRILFDTLWFGKVLNVFRETVHSRFCTFCCCFLSESGRLKEVEKFVLHFHNFFNEKLMSKMPNEFLNFAPFDGI